MKNHIKTRLSIVNPYRFLLFSICFSFSIYYLLLLGTYAQAFISSYGIYSCDNCFTEVASFTDIMSAKPIITLLITSFIIFITSVFYKERFKIYITTLISSALVLTINDTILSSEIANPIPYIIQNLMYNTFGAIFLSAFVLLNLASLNYLLKIKKANAIIISLIPITSSFIICFIIYGYLYLIYERSPTHIDALFSDKILGDIITADRDSFGFLTTYKKIDTDIRIDSYADNTLNWHSKNQKYDINVYLFSGCIITPDSFEKLKGKINPTINLNNTLTLSFHTDKPVIYYAKGKQLNAIANNVKEINNDTFNKNSGIIKNGNIKLKSPYTPFTIYINISPLDRSSYSEKLEYTLTINKQKQVIKNNIATYKVNQQGKMKCTPILGDKNELPKSNDILGLPSLVLEFIPKGTIDFLENDEISIKLKNGTIAKDKNTKNPFSEYSNGYLKHINAIGLEELKINNKKIDVSPVDLLYIKGSNLIGFITKDNKIKIFGTADNVALNTKIMNLKPISILNNKLSSLNTSIGEIIKLILGIGLFIFAGKYIIKFFKRDGKIDILCK
ncbi:Uncharacterised protein [Yersinia intermedia]|uniref:hypothetical protein n=1 Tax=Yersinia intermedia TaxID=631 RepID=UPI0005DF7D0C|nr:hypothetical protein [Yersinia intermedia]CNH85474.1 Uncharacterised protein [Yersinia intermedia]CQD80990.1 Uncharacterised protein [Yersinia intermedia]